MFRNQKKFMIDKFNNIENEMRFLRKMNKENSKSFNTKLDMVQIQLQEKIEDKIELMETNLINY